MRLRNTTIGRMLATTGAAAVMAAGAVAATPAQANPYGNPSQDVPAPGFGIGSHADWNFDARGTLAECLQLRKPYVNDGALVEPCHWEAGAYVFRWIYQY